MCINWRFGDFILFFSEIWSFGSRILLMCGLKIVDNILLRVLMMFVGICIIVFGEVF